MRIGIDVGILREKKRGVGRYLSNLLEQFSRLSSDDDIYLYSPGPIHYDFIKNQNWHARFGTLPLPGSFWLQTQCKNYIKKDGIDLFFSPAHVLPLNLPETIRKVLAVHDLVAILYPETMTNYNRFIHNIFFAKSLKSADSIITMSEATKQSIIDKFKIDDNRINVIYEGVSESFKPYQPEQVRSVLNRYGLNKPYLLSVGTLEPRKNYPLLLKAFRDLKIDYDLVIIGKTGWKFEKVFTTINELQLSKRVKILGYVKDDDLPFFYNGAEIFVFPSIYEGFGLPILEALACGTPVICSNSSSLPEVGGDAVIYFSPDSMDELVLKINQLLTNSELKKVLIQKGLSRAKLFTWGKTSQKTWRVLKNLNHSL
jgi:glycosyltransferase involved in cell wall biosynthesis